MVQEEALGFASNYRSIAPSWIVQRSLHLLVRWRLGS